jgi:hypothetical protein
MSNTRASQAAFTNRAMKHPSLGVMDKGGTPMLQTRRYLILTSKWHADVWDLPNIV